MADVGSSLLSLGDRLSFEFNVHSAPHTWLPRRFQPIINRESAYAILWNAGEREWQVCVRWWEGYDQLVGWLDPQNQGELIAARNLVESVNQLKNTYSGQQGGAFRINEFRQVIVPTGMGGAASAFCVGTTRGVMTFEHPSEGAFDLTGDGLSAGDLWGKPVVALRYTIHEDDTVSFEHSPGADTRERQRVRTKQALAGSARRIRGQAGFAFLVNDLGEAVVKCPPDWQARYVGHIDFDNWFEEETCS